MLIEEIGFILSKAIIAQQRATGVEWSLEGAINHKSLRTTGVGYITHW